MRNAFWYLVCGMVLLWAAGCQQDALAVRTASQFDDAQMLAYAKNRDTIDHALVKVYRDTKVALIDFTVQQQVKAMKDQAAVVDPALLEYIKKNVATLDPAIQANVITALTQAVSGKISEAGAEAVLASATAHRAAAIRQLDADCQQIGDALKLCKVQLKDIMDIRQAVDKYMAAGVTAQGVMNVEDEIAKIMGSVLGVTILATVDTSTPVPGTTTTTP